MRILARPDRCGRRRPRVWPEAVLVGLLALAAAPVADATPVCAAAPAACTLREAATAAGIRIGVALDRSVIDGSRPGADLAAREFDSVTAENAMKWRELSPAPGVYDFAAADALVAYAEANGQRVRGHTLVWGRANGPPTWWGAALAAAPDPAARARKLIDEHVAAVVGRYAGRIDTWDVVNEPFTIFGGSLDASNPFQQALGSAYIAQAFRAAHAADPGASLFLNEIFNQADDAKFAATLALASSLLADGVPLHGVGFQGHFIFPPTFEGLRSRLQQIADLGLAVELTEVDLSIGLFRDATDPFAAQATAYAELVRACLAVSTCTGVTTWGLDDGHTWLDDADLWSLLAPNRPLLFDEELASKPAYFAVRDALLAVPEPGTAEGVAVGLMSLAAGRRRRKTAAASRPWRRATARRR